MFRVERIPVRVDRPLSAWCAEKQRLPRSIIYRYMCRGAYVYFYITRLYARYVNCSGRMDSDQISAEEKDLEVKQMKKLIKLFAVTMLAASMAALPVMASEAANDQATEVKEVESLKIAFSPYADADEITTATEPLEQLLKDKLLEKGYDVKDIDMTVGTSYTAVGEALSAGSADLGFISGGNYVLFSDDCDVLLTALRKAINKDSTDPKDWNDGTIEEYTDEYATYYRCIILAGPTQKGQELLAKVNAGEELTWEDLNSASWTVLSPTSASGYIYPCLWLQENYGKSISDLENVVESESHTTAVSRLAAGQVDVMVSYGHIRIKNAPIWESELGGTAPMVEQTGIIGVTEGIYNDMIAYSKTSETMEDEDFRQAVGEAFIEIGETEEGQEIISVFSQVGYTWGQDSDYDGERAAQELLKSME